METVWLRRSFTEAFALEDTGAIFAFTTDPNSCWIELKRIIIKVADKICPIKPLNIRVNTVKYLTNDLLELQNDRDYFVYKANRSSDPGDRFVAKCMIRIARTAVDKARPEYYKALAKLYNQNSKKYWEVLEDIEPKSNAKIKGLVDSVTG